MKNKLSFTAIIQNAGKNGAFVSKRIRDLDQRIEKEETRQRRIVKTIELLKKGQKEK